MTSASDGVPARVANPVESSAECGPSNAFAVLHPQVQRWVWEQGWATLRDVQERAIPPILAADRDVVVSAATAAGKTEAAYLPLATRLLQETSTIMGFRVLSVSPLKALINDQYDRLQGLCERLDLPLHRRHGDVSASEKGRAIKEPGGVLLITPESLEALMVLRGSQVASLFQPLCGIVVDELHAFIGTERGMQLQSLLHRLELTIRRRVPRIGLSATLGEPGLAVRALRHDGRWPCQIVQADGGGQTVRLKLHGFIERDPFRQRGSSSEDEKPPHEENQDEIITALFQTLRGDSHLVFANARGTVEIIADKLRRRCEDQHLPNEFWPHHGNLSKAIREDVEAALKQRDTPATAICTSTLELGIDIGQMASVAQIGCPPSVAALRQRLGRSGRRGSPSVLRLYVQERALTPLVSVVDLLRMRFFQTVAMVNLMLRRWTEPPRPNRLHLSTLVQQLLSLLAQRGGIQPHEAWRVFCQTGPFHGLGNNHFKQLLRDLAKHDLITQDHDGTLVLAAMGERVVNHYTFYAAFQTPEEYRLISNGKTLGTLPVDFPLAPGQMLLFAGKRWQILEINEKGRAIILTPSQGGQPPLFSGNGAWIHDAVRQEMFALYGADDVPPYLDAGAQRLLVEGRDHFRRLDLGRVRLLQEGTEVLLFVWQGDRVLHTLRFWLVAEGIKANQEWTLLRLDKCKVPEVEALLSRFVAHGPPEPLTLARHVAIKKTEKHHPYLSEELLDLELAGNVFDPQSAWEALRKTQAS
ncbi:MAG: DEAD/DEAH box helicase [Magnetococcales bacterium]|nr:DEAD/DEAH box helicase [Magnetococcales bacterium]